VSDPAEAHGWSRVSFDPRTARTWRGAGHLDPAAASRWRDASFGPIQAKRWLAAGVQDPHTATQWIDAGVGTAIAAHAWILDGRSARDASDWTNQGFDLAAAGLWSDVGVDSSDASRLLAAGLDPSTAGEWSQQTGQPVPELLRWLDARFTPAEASMWIKAGVQSSASARRLRRSVDPATLAPLRAAGLTSAEALAVAAAQPADRAYLMRLLDGSSLVLLRGSGLSAGGWPRWMRICKEADVVALWASQDIPLGELESATDTANVRPAKLRTWLRAGFSASDMLEAHRSGLRTPKAWRESLTPDAEKDVPGDWMAGARTWLDTIDFVPSDVASLLDVVRDAGFAWADTANDLFEVPVSDEWLGEQQDRAMHATESLAREPRWPVTFEAGDLTIVLDGSGHYAVAWVGRDAVGGLVCFDTVLFDVYSTTDNPSWRYAAGIAIAWFIDCCIVLRTTRKGTLLERLTTSKPRNSAQEPAARYRPRPSFPQHVTAIRSGNRTSPRPHLIAAFIRTFRNGQQPSDEALSRAPARVRRMLKPNQTWVRESSRGGRPLLDELRTHLSRYSALADALGFADAYLDQAT
jgi:hypothetical protein